MRAEKSSQPLLSIAVPTFQRAVLLERLLRELEREIGALEDQGKVEVVISDNCSDDNTAEVVSKFAERIGDGLVHYHRQESNIGLLANFISTIPRCSGDFWMPFGDDDLVPEGALSRVVSAIESHPDSAVHVYSGEGKDAEISVSELASEQFYNLGNCGVSAVKITRIREEFESCEKLLLCSCWPITQAAFVAAGLDENPRAFHASFRSSDSPDHQKNSRYSAWYVVYTPIYALLYVAKRMRKGCGEEFYRSAVEHVLEKTRLKVYREAAWFYSTYVDTPGRIRSFRKASEKAMKRAERGTKWEVFRFAIIAYLPAWLKRLFDVPKFLFNPLWMKDTSIRVANELDTKRKGSGLINYTPSTFGG